MPGSNSNRRGKGFTLSEVLIAVAVLAILAGLAVPNVIRYQRLLHMQALDHSAQEIFLAAQNRMTARKNEGTLSRVDATPLASGGAETRYLTEQDIGELLPDLSLDDELMANHFYVVYDSAGGSVLTVLYSETAFAYSHGSQAVDKSAEERMQADLWVGYYTGSAAGTGASVLLDRPVIEIINGEKLLAVVTVKLPDGSVPWSSITLTATVNGKNLSGPFSYVTAGLNTRKYTVVLDSLDPAEANFRQLDTGVKPGENFALNVTVSSGAANVVSNSAKSAEVNSLFAEVEGDTAYVSCGRHLQNLDQTTSGVGSAITGAVQTSNIRFDETGAPDDWFTYYGKKNVAYVPIYNANLTSYDGGACTVTALTASAANAGMFHAFGGELKNISLVNPKITGTALAGGLAAYNSGALIISNCRVYHAYPDSTPKDELTANRITGRVAGGLIGQFSGALSISNSFAATLISATDSAGGLAGAGGSGSLKISSSYADCYLSGGNGTVGGLVGRMDGNVTSTISYAYSAGFVVAAGDAAGFANTAASGTMVYYSYSAMVYLGAEHVFPLVSSGSADTSYYLNTVGAVDNAYGATGKSAAELMRLHTADGYIGGSFGPATFATTHPYNLIDNMALTVYPFPKLKHLPHYGDWRAEFESGSLVYFEEYADGTHGFSGGELNRLQNKVPVLDGYAIAYAGTPPGSDPVVTYESRPYALSRTTQISLTLTGPDNKEETYYLLPILNGEIINTPTAAEGFYQPITTQIDGVETGYWFNPHFAATVGKAAAGEEAPALIASAYVRTPRHLYHLSRHSAQYASNGWRFVQQQPLNYGTYQWTRAGFSARPAVQTPIGATAALPFKGVYDGGGLPIQNIAIESSESYLGLFGYNAGVLRGVIYDSDSAVKRTMAVSGRDVTVYAGGLVGYNAGTVSDSAVAGLRLSLGNSTQSTVYLGGLVGRNAGVIRRCEAACGQLDVSSVYANAYVGGFAGGNGGTITQSAAHGAVRVSRDTAGAVRAGGFAGGNTGSVGGSYCAVGIYASGGADMSAFSPDPAGGSNYYLTDGNYTYRDGRDTYSLTYSDGSGAVGRTQLALAKQAIPGMKNLTAADAETVDDESANPYPAPLNAHRGSWLKTLGLGELGVCYWEKEEKGVKGEAGYSEEYHFSYVSAPVGGATSVSGSLLCTYHDDGGVITEYGYGYYYPSGGKDAPAIDTTTIVTTDRWNPSHALNDDAAKALGKQTEDRYTFVVYDTYDIGAKAGLRPTGTAQNGTWTLKYQGGSYPYTISPFFADAMRYDGSGGAIPGTAGKPYGVRALKQLQFINWNGSSGTYSNEANGAGCAYLSTTSNNQQPNYYWRQGHDLSSKKQDVGYAPIGSFSSWFGGQYDGNDYKIEDLSFASKFRAVGLFGVTLGGTMKNIVMTSSDGTAQIVGTTDSTSYSGVGGLAGIALKGSANGTISNCSISGYQIINNATNLGADDRSKTTTYGAATGGLVGWCNMDFSKCSAVTTVSGGSAVKSYTGDYNHWLLGASTREEEKYSVLRLGGLAGSAVCTITDCYVGGEVRDDSSGKVKTSYVGGMVGYNTLPGTGSGGGGTKLVLNNCYSYAQITQGPGGGWPTRAVYPLSVGGGSNYQVNNSYYLGERTTGGATSVHGTRLSYAEFSDTQTSTGLLKRLGGGFSTVTTEESGVKVDGKYSYPSDRRLDGLNYPFPTVLTQGGANVHYGDWPEKGFVRLDPVELDLVATKDGVSERASAIPLEFTPELDVSLGGSYAAPQVEDASIASAAVSPKGELTVTGLKEGFTSATVSYHNNADKTTYRLVVEVVVTAVVRVTVDPAATVSPEGGSADFACAAADRNGNPLAVQWISVVSNAPALAGVKTDIGADGHFTAEAKAEGDAVFTVEAAYADPLDAARTYPGTGRAGFTVLPVDVSVQSVTMDVGQSLAYPADGVSVTVQGQAVTPVTVTGVTVADSGIAAAELTDGKLTLTGRAAGTTTAVLALSYEFGGAVCHGTANVAVEVRPLVPPAISGGEVLWVETGTTASAEYRLEPVPVGKITYRADFAEGNNSGNSLLTSFTFTDGTLSVTAKKSQTGSVKLRLEAYLDGQIISELVITVKVYSASGGWAFEETAPLTYTADVVEKAGSTFSLGIPFQNPATWSSPSKDGIFAEADTSTGNNRVKVTLPSGLPPGDYVVMGTGKNYQNQPVDYILSIHVI